MADHTTLTASTPAPAAALAQSRAGGAPAHPALPPARPPPGAGYALGAGVTRTVARAPDPQRGMPLYRPLRIFALDPSVSHREGGITTVNVAYETLQAGPSSRLFLIDPHDPSTGADYAPARLDDPYPAISGGYEPASSNARFHKQMLYAVCSNVYAAFRGALGREPTWGFERITDAGRLWLQPHGFRGINAHYDKETGTLCFGYDKSVKLQAAVRTLPGEYVFTCLSHDIIAHEMTHAILDGLRSHFTIPSHPDVPAFHEAFADLVAIFQRLGCRELVRSAIVANRGRPDQATLLADIARQVGHVTGCAGALRSAISSAEVQLYDDTLEAHALGAVLVGAVFDAFLTVFRCKTARYLRLATDGTGVLRDGALPAELADVLAEKTSALASQFQALIIRAIDYCPPVDIRFGEFLRAMVTADMDLVPDDSFGYREALIDAFLRRRILPRGVSNVSEGALLWNTPRLQYAPLAELSFAKGAYCKTEVRGRPRLPGRQRGAVAPGQCAGRLHRPAAPGRGVRPGAARYARFYTGRHRPADRDVDPQRAAHRSVAADRVRPGCRSGAALRGHRGPRHRVSCVRRQHRDLRAGRRDPLHHLEIGAGRRTY
jgi:hypothetical protein